MAKKRYELRVSPALASRLDRFIEDEHVEDARRFFDARPTSHILAAILAAGLDWFEARARLRDAGGVAEALTADITQKPEITQKGRQVKSNNE